MTEWGPPADGPPVGICCVHETLNQIPRGGVMGYTHTRIALGGVHGHGG